MGNLIHEVPEKVLVEVLQKLNKRALEAWCKAMRRKLAALERRDDDAAIASHGLQSDEPKRARAAKAAAASPGCSAARSSAASASSLALAARWLS